MCIKEGQACGSMWPPGNDLGKCCKGLKCGKKDGIEDVSFCIKPGGKILVGAKTFIFTKTPNLNI